MKRLTHPLAALALVLLTACAALGVPTPETFNEREAAAISSVTAARELTTSLLVAGRISPADARNVQQQADNLREGIAVASAIHATDPGAAENRLTAAITALSALNQYLAGRK